MVHSDTAQFTKDYSKLNNREMAVPHFGRRLRLLGIIICVFILWNGVCDLIYGYSPDLSGSGYFSPAAWDVIRTAGGRPHWMVMLAQTAGWLYPLYALSYYLWWVGMRRAGFWLAHLPCAVCWRTLC